MKQTVSDRPWLDGIRELHDASFSVDWASHLAELNARLDLSGDDRFGLPAGLPPSWFVGDIEVLVPRRWVLVLSLNQARRDEDDDWHLAQNYTPQTYWDHWRWLNRDWWEPRFYRPLVRLAAASLGVEVGREQEADFATSQMVFAELCPYPSRRWGIAADALAGLANDDPGFKTATRVRELLMAEAKPSLVLLNGVAALDSVRSIVGDRIRLVRHEYQSQSRPEKNLWHEEGHYSVGEHSVPVLGFPFLRKPHTHNSYVEIDQLGVASRAFVLS